MVFSLSSGGKIAALSNRARGLAAGDIGSPVPHLGASGPLGDLARDLETLRAASEARETAAAEQARQLQTAEAERRRLEEIVRGTEAEQSLMAQTLGEALAKLAQGDLTCRIDRGLPPQHDQLRTHRLQGVEVGQPVVHSACQCSGKT